MARTHQRLIKRAYKAWNEDECAFVCVCLRRSHKKGEEQAYRDLYFQVEQMLGFCRTVESYLHLPPDLYYGEEATAFREHIWKTLADRFGVEL